MAGLSAQEARALAMGLEIERDLPTGSLQAIGEQMTGYRADNPLLPAHVARAPDRADEYGQSAARFSEKLGEFDGIMPLAIDAYYRGDKATRASIAAGKFPQEAVDAVHETLARMPKYGGQEMNDADVALLNTRMGAPSHDLRGVREAPIPKAAKPVQLRQVAGGRWKTGDPFFDAVMDIESGGQSGKGGVAHAVSPTGATGLFQFTRGTGKAYGLIANGRDLRKDPAANFAAMQKLTQDNAKRLADAGMEVNPSTLYLAHQQGVGGAIALLKAAKSGRDVPGNIRANMNVNGGRGLTPAQFVAKFDRKIREAYARNGAAADYGAPQIDTSGADAVLAQAAQSGIPPADAAAYGPTAQGENPLDLMMREMPSTATADVMDAAGQSRYTTPDRRDEEGLPKTTSVDWIAQLDDIFAQQDNSRIIPPLVRSAISGIITGVSTHRDST